MNYRVWLGAVVIAVLASVPVPNTARSAYEACQPVETDHDPLSLYGDEMVFSVLRDGDPIGVHRVSFDADGDQLIVASRFEAQVKIMFLTVFEYWYESKSIWQDGCMVDLMATTDDNGERSRVSARQDKGRLLIDGPSGKTQATAGLFPTDHWHAGVLQRDQVLNTITGRVASIDIADLGEKPVTVNAKPASARHYVYSGDLYTEVWYDDSGRWVKMRFQAEDGSTIEYVCQKCRREG